MKLANLQAGSPTSLLSYSHFVLNEILRGAANADWINMTGNDTHD